mgnify:FL=1|jgi:hypothetical protein
MNVSSEVQLIRFKLSGSGDMEGMHECSYFQPVSLACGLSIQIVSVTFTYEQQ